VVNNPGASIACQACMADFYDASSTEMVIWKRVAHGDLVEDPPPMHLRYGNGTRRLADSAGPETDAN